MLESDKIAVSGEIDVNITNGLRKSIICHYWYFLDIYLRFQPKLCDGCFIENHNHYYYKVLLGKCSYK